VPYFENPRKQKLLEMMTEEGDKTIRRGFPRAELAWKWVGIIKTGNIILLYFLLAT
jgi:hypothetical protein